MASYNELLALIDAYINQNGVQAITGQVLNGVLRAMVDQLGRGYSIMGIADPTTDPGTPDGPESWFASVPGTYTNFGGLEVADAEFAMFSYTPSSGWTKATLTEGITEVAAGVDDNVGTPSAEVTYQNGALSFQFYNLKGQTGDAAGFGNVSATVDGNIGTPGVTVQASGPDTAKNFVFNFTNLKGETGVTSVLATVDNTSGNPQCAVSLNGQQLVLNFTGLKGAQGDTGSSVDYPFTIVNNLTTDDATQALSAAQGVVLAGQVSQLEHKVNEEIDGLSEATATGSGWTFVSLSPSIPKGAVITEAVLDGNTFGSTFFFKDGDGNQYNVSQSQLPYTAPEEFETVTLGQSGAVVIKYQVPGLKQRVKKNETDITTVTAQANATENKVKDLDYSVNGDRKIFNKQAGYNDQYLYLDIQLKAGRTYKIIVRPNTLFSNGADLGQLYINSPRTLLVSSIYSGFESTFSVTADTTGDLLLYVTRGNMKDTTGTLHDIDVEIYSNIGVIEEEKKPKSYPKAIGLYGRGTSTQSFTAETIPGHTYRVYFLTRTWSWDTIGSGNNAFILRDGNGNNVYAYDPQVVPDGWVYKDFVAETNTYDLIIRADIDETVKLLLDDITDLFDKSIVSYNGGYTNVLERLTTLNRKSIGGSSPSRFNLVFYSDIHNGEENNQRIADFFNTFKSNLDDVIHGGDSVYDAFSDTNTVATFGGQSFLNVVGNHDVNKGGGAIATGLEYYNKFIAPNVAKWGDVVFPEDAATNGYCYYYKDYSGAKIRLIALDCMHWDSTQKDWLVATLADAKTNGLSVMCVSHYCPDRFPTMILECTFCTLYTADVNAGLDSEAEDAVADAINNGLDFIGWLFGHTHRDYFVKSHNHPEQFCVGVDRGYGGIPGDDSTRAEGTRFYDSFDIISVDVQAGILSVSKIGVNADRLMRQKNFLVFDYKNRQIISNT